MSEQATLSGGSSYGTPEFEGGLALPALAEHTLPGAVIELRRRDAAGIEAVAHDVAVVFQNGIIHGQTTAPRMTRKELITNLVNPDATSEGVTALYGVYLAAYRVGLMIIRAGGA